jgi:putative DNA primase/helicase
MIFDAIVKVAKECAIDSASDFVKALVWDKQARLDTWLSKTFGCPDDIYHQAVASNWLKGMMKRITEPGRKFDYVLVLEGAQGSRKSTSLAILGRDWHVETTMGTDSKDFFMQFQGKAIIEFSEGETMSRTEVKKMKAIITTQVDRYRPSYGRFTEDFPRRCVFAMTTNQEEYLKDETGNRRWLPAKVVFDHADTDWLEANRDQLFAEAYYRISVLKETTYEFPGDETQKAQEARRIKDPNSDLVVDWYWNECTEDQRLNGITVHQVYKEALHANFPSRPLNRYEEMGIADMLKSALKLTKRRVMIDGRQMMRWFDDGGKKIEEIQVVRNVKKKEDFGVFSDPDEE